MHAAGTLVRTAAASCGSAAHLHYGHLSNDGLIEYINPSLWSTIAPSQLMLYY